MHIPHTYVIVNTIQYYSLQYTLHGGLFKHTKSVCVQYENNTKYYKRQFQNFLFLKYNAFLRIIQPISIYLTCNLNQGLIFNGTTFT